MPDLLTPDELAAIAEREAKATEGPLQVNTLNGYPRTLDEMKADLCQCLDLSVASGKSVPAVFVVSTGSGDDGLVVAVTGNGPTSEDNAHFIAHARADIPALLAHIAALETLVEVTKPAPADDDTTVKISENDYADFERCEKPAPTLPADMEALLADAGYKAVLAALRQEAVDKCGGGFGAPDLDADYQLSLSLLVREVYQILNIEQHIDALTTALRETLAREQAERARAEEAEAERDALQEECDSLRSACHTLDQAVGNCPGCVEAQADLAAARKELAGLGPVEYMVNTDAHGWRVTHIFEWEHVRSINPAKTDTIRRVLGGEAMR